MRNPYLGPTFSDTQSEETQKSLAILSILEEFSILISEPTDFKKIRTTMEAFCFYFKVLLKVSKVKQEAITPILQRMYQLVTIIQWNKSSFLSEYEPILQSFFSALFPFFEEIKTNENLLFYLLEKRESFNQFLGKNRIDMMISNLFPEGKPEIQKILLENYAKRGFHNMLEKCDSLVETIIWHSA
jgi:hypothetical protein